MKKFNLLFFLLLLGFNYINGDSPRVTVWVHGTIMQTVFYNVEKQTMDTLNMWNSCPIGLHRLEDVSCEHQVRLVGENLSKQNQFPREHCYLFGWVGTLDINHRIKAGKQLFYELEKLVATYRAQGDEPIITVLSHSHGGNVLLNMALVCPEEPPFTIEQLILLACPVQKETEEFINHPLFTKIYSIHSHRDMIQILDPQGFHLLAQAIKQAVKERSFKPLLPSSWMRKEKIPLFSQRHFVENNKVIQVEVQWKDTIPWTEEDFAFLPEQLKRFFKVFSLPLKKPHSVLHNEFIIPSFINRLGEIIDQIDQLQANNEIMDSIDHRVFV